jgi:branched-subunit amino acid ABC-type transport system permease component
MLAIQHLVLIIFGGSPRRISPPVAYRFQIFDLQYPLMRIMIALISIAMMISLWIFLRKTKYGLWMRAVVQDREMAVGLGIPVNKVYMWTFVRVGFGGLFRDISCSHCLRGVYDGP